MNFFLTELVVVAFCAAFSNANDEETTAKAFKKITKAFERWHMENSPMFSSQFFKTEMFQHEAYSHAFEAFEHRKDISEGFLTGLQLLDRSKLNESDRLNYDILEDMLVTYVDGASNFTDYGNLNPVNFLDSPFFQVLKVANLAIPVANSSEQTFRSFLAYLSNWQIMGMQIENLMRKAMELNRTLHASTIDRMIPIMDEAISLVNTSKSLEETMEPFKESLMYSPNLNERLRINLQVDIRMALRRVVLPGLLRMRDFLIDEYLPTCRKTAGVIEWDPDHKYYEACVKWHTSLRMKPEHVHKLGLKEVDRINNQLKEIIRQKSNASSTTVLEFIRKLNDDLNDPVTNEDDLINRYDNVLPKIKAALPKMFHAEDIPSGPMWFFPFTYNGFDNTFFYYDFENKLSVLLVNTINLSQHLPYAIPAGALLGIPGHHMYTKIIWKPEIPDFRRFVETEGMYSVPVRFPAYKAYLDGWAHYAQTLGHEDYLDIFETEAEVFGALLLEMFRACQLVVDTGLHNYGWTRERAVKYFCDNAGLQRSAAESAVDCILVWPGYALSHKIGEITFKNLREEAEIVLGYKFDIRDFHHTVLSIGPMPLNLLQQEVRRWYYNATL